MDDTIRLSTVTLDCPDARELAEFYAAITSGTVGFSDAAYATVDGPRGRIDFQTVAGYTPPVWPDPASSIQMHLDFFVDDLMAAGHRVVAAGATRFDFQPNADHCIVYADPAGHPFCLTTWDDVGAATGATQPLPTPPTEMQRLLTSLGAQREHVLGALSGVADEDLRRPMLPSGWTCLGMVQHLTLDIERFWFRGVVGGDPTVIDRRTDPADTAWRVPRDVEASTVLAAYRAEIEHGNRVLAAARLDAAPARWPDDLFGDWRLADVREIVLHVITETACHAGHLDAAGELIDGRTWMVVPD